MTFLFNFSKLIEIMKWLHYICYTMISIIILVTFGRFLSSFVENLFLHFKINEMGLLIELKRLD